MISKASLEALPHVLALLARCPEQERARFAQDSPDGRSIRAALDYLGTRVVQEDGFLERFVTEHDAQAPTVNALAGEVRVILRYRAYVGEWISAGRPALQVPEPTAPRFAAVPRPVERAREEPPPRTVVGRVLKRVRGWFDVKGSVIPAPKKRGSSHLRNSWTGSVGTESYYDKDSSPE